MSRITQLHDEACHSGNATYLDPETGASVFTREALLARGRCCGSGCRHCPFAHEAVKPSERAGRIRQPAWMTDQRPGDVERAVLLFWSGGKDSYLAYRALCQQGFEVILLTTFDSDMRTIAHQEIGISVVVRQAAALGVSLIGVPLAPACSYEERITTALALVPGLRSVAFGDLHLENIRRWREELFAALDPSLTLHFPLWHVPYEELLDDLEASGAGCRITAVTDDRLVLDLGKAFDRQFAGRLPDGIDTFGENGEFHTEVVLEGKASRG